MTVNSQPPKPQKRRSSGRIYLITAIIALCGVVLSGLVGYGAATYVTAKNDNTVIIHSENTTGTDGQTQVSVDVIDVSDVVEMCRPSVVEITTEVVSNGNSIFGQYISQGAGSGVIMTADGYIVTNNHVIENASSITVTLYNGQSYSANLIGTDPATDVAVIKIQANDLNAAIFGNSDSIKVGEPAIAIGNPLGSLGGTVTTGIISAVGREITVENETMTLLQTDAAINPGNSGGGLFNASGQLIGIVNAKQSATGIEGLGFAIPISDVTSIIDDLVTNGTVTSRPFINVSLQDVTSNSISSYFSNLEPGVYIAQVVEGGAADQAGLEVGDQIVSVDGQSVSSSAEVKKIIRALQIGDVIEVEYVRDGQTYETEVVLNGNLE